MMKTLLSLLCIATWTWAGTPESKFSSTPFVYELRNVAAPDSSKSRLLVSIAFLYDDLSFVKGDSGYAASYEFTIAVTNGQGDWVANREGRDEILVHKYADTNSRRKYNLRTYEFDLLPGKYHTTFSFTDRMSKATSHVNADKELRPFAADRTPLELSDMIFLDHATPDSLNRLDITPDLYNSTTTPEQGLHLYMEMFSSDMAEPLLVQQKIRDWQGKAVLEQQRAWPRRAQLERLVLPIWTEMLPFGIYDVEMKVQQGKVIKTAQDRFHVTWNGIPQNDVHLNQALSAALYLANKDERRKVEMALESAEVGYKREALLAFWERRDDSWETSENEAMNTYYLRVELANAKFSGRRLEGWKTDLGKVFVTFGAPDLIEVLKDNVQTASTQVWHYRSLARRFFFVDSYGNGDYRLVRH